MVTPDEIYHFKTPINPVKVSANEIAALEQGKNGITGDVDVKNETTEIFLNEDSLDGAEVPSVISEIPIVSPAPTPHLSTPISTKKVKGKGKLVSGYILYSSEVRKERAQSNPDCSFGDISRMVGNEWRNMSAQEKQYWEEKASKSNEESALKYAEEHGCSSPAPQATTIFTAEPLPNQVFECGWDKCDYQFEDPMDCFDHCISEGSGHVQSHYNTIKASGVVVKEYNCFWRGCLRQKKNMPPFPHLQRLVKHVREVHINKSGRIVQPHDRSKNFVPKKQQPIVQQTIQTSLQSPGTMQMNANSQMQQQQQQQSAQTVQCELHFFFNLNCIFNV